MRYLFINAYSASNRGDAGIVVAMVNLIKEYDSDAEIYVMSSYSKENKDFYNQYGVKSVPSVWEIRPEHSMLRRYVNGLKNIILANIFPKSLMFKEYHKADIVISVGGGYLYSSRKGFLGAGLLSALFHIWLGKKFGKVVLAFPQSVGPLNFKLDRLIVKKVLKKVDRFFSREEYTTRLLKGLGIKQVTEIADIGFTLRPQEPKKIIFKELREKFNSKSPNIGVTVMDWRFARAGSAYSDIENYLKKLANACKKVLSDFPNGHIYIFPQVTVGEGDTDYNVSFELEKLIEDSKSTVINLEEFIDKPEELVYLYGEMDILIGSRMHSTIFGLAGLTPTIALAYQPKTLGTYKLMGLDGFVDDIEDFSEEGIYLKIKSILEHKGTYPFNNIEREVHRIKEEIFKELSKFNLRKYKNV